MEKKGSQVEKVAVDKVKCIKVGRLGLAYFTPLANWQPDNVCRACGQATNYQVVTKERLKIGGIAMPCCPNQRCYDSDYVIGQIKNLLKREKSNKEGLNGV